MLGSNLSADPEVGSEDRIGRRAGAALPTPFIFNPNAINPTVPFSLDSDRPSHPNSLAQPTTNSNSR